MLQSLANNLRPRQALHQTFVQSRSEPVVDESKTNAFVGIEPFVT